MIDNPTRKPVAGRFAGILLVSGFLDLPRGVAEAMSIVNLIIGIVLIVLGVLRLLGK